MIDNLHIHKYKSLFFSDNCFTEHNRLKFIFTLGIFDVTDILGNQSYNWYLTPADGSDYEIDIV